MNQDEQRAQLVDSFRNAASAFHHAALMADNLAHFVQHELMIPKNSNSSPFAHERELYAAFTDAAAKATGISFGRTIPGQEGPKKRGRKKNADVDSLQDEFNADGSRKRKRGVKKLKDPNAPKRPPSAYLLYQNDVRKKVQADHPDKSYHEVLSEISKAWAALPEQEKKPYLEQTTVAKQAYDEERKAYALTNPSAQTPVDKIPAMSDAEGDDDDEENATLVTHVAPVVPVVQEPASETDSDEEEEEESSDEDTPPPPPKKQRKSVAPVVPVVVPTVVKEEKSKKVKKEKAKKA